ncbi:MAG: hypothetical protein Kow0088_18670 [Anaerolineales bacterium]
MPISKSERPISVTSVYVFNAINALIWFGFGLILLADLHPALPDSTLLKGIMASLSFGMSGLILLLWMFLIRKNRIAYFLILGLYIGNSLLTIFDDFGLADFIVLLLNVLPAILLVKDRAWHLQPDWVAEGRDKTA